MEVVIVENPEAVAEHAAAEVIAAIARKPNLVLGLATGNTPLGLYNKLIENYSAGEVDFAAVTTFNLDEFLGLPIDAPGSYRSYMRRNFFDRVNLNHALCNIPDSSTEDVLAECDRYEQKIADAGGVDLWILGIGENGHIGFNEPGSSLGSRTRFKALTEQTRKSNSSLFNSLDEVPHYVMTVGVGTITDARNILLLAHGEKKAEIIREAVEGPICAEVTATALQMHRSTVLLIDEAAASKLKRKDYYKYAYEHKWKYLQK